MSVEVICHGCGHLFSTGPDYRRNKIQCPACGVICSVPAAAGRREPRPDNKPAEHPSRRDEPAPSVSSRDEDEALGLLNENNPDPTPAPRKKPPKEEIPRKQPTSPFDDDLESRQRGRPTPPRPAAESELLFNCRHCRRRIRRQGQCPDCNGAPEPDAQPIPMDPSQPTRHAPVIPNLSLDDEPRSRPAPSPTSVIDDDDEDANPYATVDQDLPTCVKCQKEMPEDAVVCLACGYDRRQGRKLVKTYEPMARSWDTTMSLQTRLIWFTVALCVTFALGLFTAIADERLVGPWFTSWLLFGGFMAFLTGTYERIELTRTRKGRVTITHTWRYFFIPAKPRSSVVRGYGSVAAGQLQLVGFWEWLIFAGLVFGIVTAILWWYFVIHKLSYYVALTQDHGHPSLYVYRGRSEEQMRDIRDTLINATGLPLDN